MKMTNLYCYLKIYLFKLPKLQWFSSFLLSLQQIENFFPISESSEMFWLLFCIPYFFLFASRILSANKIFFLFEYVCGNWWENELGRAAGPGLEFCLLLPFDYFQSLFKTLLLVKTFHILVGFCLWYFCDICVTLCYFQTTKTCLENGNWMKPKTKAEENKVIFNIRFQGKKGLNGQKECIIFAISKILCVWGFFDLQTCIYNSSQGHLLTTFRQLQNKQLCIGG